MNKLLANNPYPFYLGHLEIERWQKLINANHKDNLSSLIKNYGLIIQQYDTNSFASNWIVTQVPGQNKVNIAAGLGLIKTFENELTLINNSTTFQADIPTGDATYKLLVKSAPKQTEQGTVSITDGTKIVYGTNTKFTELFGANRRIIIKDNPYVVATVQSDTQLTLETEMYDGDLTDEQFKVGGWFPTYPVGLSDNYIYQYSSLEFAVKTTAKLDYEYWLAEIVVSGGVITTITDKRQLNIFKMNLNVPDIDQTPASTFKVGGRYVELEEDTPPDVKNFRITDIFGNSINDIDVSMTGEISNPVLLGNTNKLNVLLEWGYNNITGNGAVDLFTINTAGLSFTANELSGYFLYIPTLTKNLKIVSNSATSGGLTVLVVEEEGGGSWNGTGVVVNSANPAIIHHNADRYEVVAIPAIANPIRIDEQGINYGESPTLQKTVLSLDVGKKYYIKIRAVKGKSFNNYVTLGSGSFTKYSVSQSYSSPLLVKHPQIDSTGLVVFLNSQQSGFSLEVTAGWNEATQYEIVYSTEASKATFTENSGNVKEVFNGRVFEKISSVSRRYYARVRPLISGHAVASQYPVADPLSVVSGNFGYQNEQVIAQPYIQHRTYSGDVDITLTGGVMVGELTNVYSPASSSTAVTGLSNLEGNIITINSNDYMITALLGGVFIELQSIGSSPVLSTAAYTFTIGVSKRARRKLRTNNFPINYKIVRLDVDSDVKRGEDITVRVYQESNEGAADHLIVLNSETGYSKDVDIELSGTYGQRTLIIDLWDPASSGAKNKGELSALVTVYARPLNTIGDPVGIGTS